VYVCVCVCACVCGCVEAVNNRTCIIGAGPSGLSLAWRLTQNGQNVTVFEKEGRVGGKVLSWVDPVYWGYDLTTKFMRRYGIKSTDVMTNWMTDEFENMGEFLVPVLNVIGDLLNAVHHPNELNIMGLDNWLWECSHCFEYGFGYQPGGNRTVNTHAKEAARRYFRMPTAPPDFGFHVKGGFKSIFSHIANELPNSTLRLNHTVRSLRRTDDGVWVDDEECASVVVTAIPSTLNPSFGFTQEEQDIFGRLRTTPYFSAIVDMGCAINKTSLKYGQYDALKQRQHRDKYLTVLGYHNLADTEAQTVDKMKASLKDHLGCEPREVVAFKVWYDYDPRFDQADVDDGIIERIEAMQGNKHTYWAGTYMTWDVVEGALEYSKHLYGVYLNKNKDMISASKFHLIQAHTQNRLRLNLRKAHPSE